VLSVDVSQHGPPGDTAAADLWVGICGPFSLKRDGVETGALPAGQRAVLGFLALSAGPVAVLPDVIIDALWPDDPPATASAIVYTYISRLRRLLKGDGDRNGPISRDAVGYRLNLTAERLDLLEFRRLAGMARAESDSHRACDHYEHAMRLWRGDPLEDVPVLRTHHAVTALANERVGVVLEYADRAAAIGRSDMVLTQLKSLTAGHPLDERLHAALMVALAGSGRQAEALRVYEEVRRRLDDELGVQPADELRYTHQRVLRQDVTPGKSAADWHEVRQLPAAPADFTGREEERRALTDVLAAPENHPGVPLAVISGQPGMGKTALALYTAHTVSPQFPDGQLWIQLAGASARPRVPGEVLGEMLRAVGIPGLAIPDDHSERPAALRSALAGRKVLIVLDDAASAGQVAPLLPGTSGCAVIVTSRVQLHDLEGAAHVPLDVLPTDDAVQLLGRLSSHNRVASDRAGATQLAQACGGLPLALRIVGSRLATRPQWPLSTMVRKLTQAGSRLEELEAGSLSVRASIDSSYVAIPDLDRLAFRRLALLGPNDFAGWVIPVLLGELADDVLDDLVGRSLITPIGVDCTGEPRYRLHDLLRDFAAERLAEDADGDTDSAVERLHEAWLQLARRADEALPSEPYFPPARKGPRISVVEEKTAGEITQDPIAWFTAERINLMTAVEQACERGRIELTRALVSCHASFHYLQDRQDESVLMWRKAAVWTDESADGVWVRLRLGSSLVERGRPVEARSILDGCVASAERLESDDPELLAFALYWRSACLMDLDIYQAARADAERGVEVAVRNQLYLGEIQNLRRLGSAAAFGGEGESGVALAERAVSIAAELFGGSYCELAAIHNLAFVCSVAGFYERALETSVLSIELSRKLGSVRDEAISHGVLGDAYRGLGEYRASIDALLHALSVLRAHHVDRHAAVCLLKLGYTYEDSGQVAEAIRYFEQARELFRELHLTHKVDVSQQALDRCRALRSASPGALRA
jgi:DNA-binding SARP family transcriptional activator/tetratricopeptide (TPR) repeat protein